MKKWLVKYLRWGRGKKRRLKPDRVEKVIECTPDDLLPIIYHEERIPPAKIPS